MTKLSSIMLSAVLIALPVAQWPPTKAAMSRTAAASRGQ